MVNRSQAGPHVHAHQIGQATPRVQIYSGPIYYYYYQLSIHDKLKAMWAPINEFELAWWERTVQTKMFQPNI